jgi:hypothetical protein
MLASIINIQDANKFVGHLSNYELLLNRFNFPKEEAVAKVNVAKGRLNNSKLTQLINL